ncbi:MAG: DUF1697 domain-containing protein, partial [Actinobacteria bacterium]
HRKMPMADLRSMMTDLGFMDVQTYIQSGNVAFDDGPEESDEASRLISTGIEDAFGFEVPVVVRTYTDLVQARSNSRRHFPAHDTDDFPHEKNVHVIFLSDHPDECARLEVERFPTERFVLDGRELHVRYSDGAGQSKLTLDIVEKVFGVSATARNLATVEKLIEMAGA